MALKDLPTEEMIDITSTWVDPDHAHRRALASIPVLAALLPDIEEAHTELCAGCLRELTPENILTIVHTQKHIDHRHDNVLRAIWHRLTAESYITRDPQLAAALRRLRTTLLPDGLDSTQKSYGDEAAQAESMVQRLTRADRALMAHISMADGTTLLDAIDEWIVLAAQLGILENERRRGLFYDDDTPRSSQTLACRNQWARTIHAARTVAALVGSKNQTIRDMMRALDAAEQRHAGAQRA